MRELFDTTEKARSPFITAEKTVIEPRPEASIAGIKQRDKIIALNGKSLNNNTDFETAEKFEGAMIGETMRFTIEQRGETGDIEQKEILVVIHRVERSAEFYGRLIVVLMFANLLPALRLLLGFWVVLVRPKDFRAWLLLFLLLGLNVTSETRITIYPTAVTLQELQSQRFVARVNYWPNARVIWSLSPANSVGTLSQIGNYRAPNVIDAARTITITATVPGNPAASASAVIQLVGGAPTSEFIGESDSLRPYRRTLTEQEVRHTLRKVALGGSPDLVTIGTQQGLSALNESLVNCVEGPELKQQAINSLGQDPRNIYWHMAATRQYWFAFLVHGCGLQEQMALHLHNWFAADGNKDDGTFFYYARPTQVDLFRDHGLGNFQDLLMKVHFDMTENHMLDNRYNSKWNVNENYGREFLELLTTGTKDSNGNQIYDEQTMHDVARSMTGFNENWRHPTGNDPPFVNGDYSYIYFDPERWDSAPKTVFGATQSFNYETLTSHILYNTPYARR